MVPLAEAEYPQEQNLIGQPGGCRDGDPSEQDCVRLRRPRLLH